MLIGSYHYHLEAKGRLAIPKTFQTDLGDQPILTRGIETCLQLLPFNTWKKLTQNLGDNPLSGTLERQLRRLLAGQAAQISYDTQGRILIPDYLRDTAGLTHQVVVTGAIDWVEIWDRNTYVDYMADITSKAPALAQQLEAKHHHPNLSGDESLDK